MTAFRTVKRIFDSYPGALPDGDDPQFYEDKAYLRRELKKAFGKTFVFVELLTEEMTVVLTGVTIRI